LASDFCLLIADGMEFRPRRVAELKAQGRLHAMLTDFERDFQAQGIQTLRAAYAKDARSLSAVDCRPPA
jgi:hypothetical protein